MHLGSEVIAKRLGVDHRRTVDQAPNAVLRLADHFEVEHVDSFMGWGGFRRSNMTVVAAGFSLRNSRNLKVATTVLLERLNVSPPSLIPSFLPPHTSVLLCPCRFL